MHRLSPATPATVFDDIPDFDDLAAFDAFEARDAVGRALRHDGWTADRQRVFLNALADGRTVTQACDAADMSTRAAYAFRRRAAGRTFALAWDAALLHARTVLADALFDRALRGQTETVTHDGGAQIVRHRYDTRLALALLARLDRLAEGGGGTPSPAALHPASPEAARLAAQDFGTLLDLIGTDDVAPDADPADAAPTDAADRAAPFLAAPFLADAVVAETRRVRELHELVADADPAPEADEPAGDDGPPVVDEYGRPYGIIWSTGEAPGNDWRTGFPPPPGFTGWQQGRYGDRGYERDLTADETAAMQREEDEERAQRAGAAAAARDWAFGFVPAPPAGPDAIDPRVCGPADAAARHPNPG